MELMSPREKKWLKMGKSEGKTEQAKFCVLEALKIRFGTISETLEVQVSRIEEIEKLRNLHRMAIKAPNLKDFEKSFSEVQIQ